MRDLSSPIRAGTYQRGPQTEVFKTRLMVACSVNSQSLLTFVFRLMYRSMSEELFLLLPVRFSAALGQEVSYITFLPFTHWNIDPYLSRRLTIIWVVSIIITYGTSIVSAKAICFSTLHICSFKKSLRAEFLPGLLWENGRENIKLKLWVSKTRRGEMMFGEMTF